MQFRSSELRDIKGHRRANGADPHNEAPMMASASQIKSQASPLFPPSRAERGLAADGVRVLLRLEGFAVFAAALALYAHAGFSWPIFALLFLAPDLSMLAYLAGPRAGAVGHNLAHTYMSALALAFAGFFGGAPIAAAGGLIWIAHIGFDRALGYGLKYQTGFGDTHLGHLGWR
jgi:Domain of unknown function (DUF4260)